jgi:hypothetical protein
MRVCRYYTADPDTLDSVEVGEKYAEGSLSTTGSQNPARQAVASSSTADTVPLSG